MQRVLALWLMIVAFGAKAAVVDLDTRFEKTKAQISGKTIDVYIADDEEKRSRGLMFVEKMPEHTGMLFVFESAMPLHFWMKNTVIPLAIGYFDPKGILQDVHEMKVEPAMVTAQATYPSKTSAQFALEMNAGWYRRNRIKVGARLRLLARPKSPLLQGSPLISVSRSGQ